MKKIPSGFPLKKHANGQWCAYINGKRRYFGSGEPEDALENYQKRLKRILDGDEDREKIIEGHATIKEIITFFLEYLEKRVKTNELSALRKTDYIRVFQSMIDVLGADTKVSKIKQFDCEKLREKLAEGCRLDRLNRKIKMIFRLFDWAENADYIELPKHLKKWLDPPTQHAREREKNRTPHFFTAKDIQRMILAAQSTIYPLQWKALILTAINCGFGARDLSDLAFEDLDLDKNIVFLQRGKTGTSRRCVLWEETTSAIQEYLEKERPETTFSDRVFVTSEGTLWNYDTEKSRVDSLGLTFRRLMTTLEIKETSFYSLRRTFRTVADEVGDIPAVNLIMGHTDYTMGGVYRQYIKDERLQKVVEHVREWLQDVNLPALTQAENERWEKIRKERSEKLHAPRKRETKKKD